MKKVISKKSEPKTELVKTEKKSGVILKKSASEMIAAFNSGEKLVSSLEQKRVAQQMNLDEMAAEIGLSVSVLHQILKKRRDLNTLPMDLVKKLAVWLDMPTVQVAMMAGVVTPEDMFVTRTLDQKLMGIYETIIRDPKWAGYMPDAAAFAKSDREMRIALALMYQEIKGKQLVNEVTLKEYQATSDKSEKVSTTRAAKLADKMSKSEVTILPADGKKAVGGGRRGPGKKI